jgi:hypothetical protein
MLIGIDREISKVRAMIDSPTGTVIRGLSNIILESSPM